MAFLMILLIYLSLPLIELGIIIVLAVSRNHYKTIAEQMKGYAPERGMPQGVTAVQAAAVPPGDTAIKPVAVPLPAPVARKLQKKEGNGFQQGTVLLVIGVIFVILAGLIFATTTWSILPSVTKAVLVLMTTALFFGASAAAERKFRIRKTGKAFYILGSIFVFVTTLAFGYFGLLGQAMTFSGVNNRTLFFLGMLLTEIALFYGMKFFEDKVYTMVFLYGITVTVLLLISSWKLPDQLFTLGMAAFSGAVVLAEPLIRRGNGIRSGRIAAMYPAYAAPNLWLISMLVLVWTGFGFFSGLAALLVGTVHFYQGSRQERRQDSEAFSSTAFLFVGIAKLLYLKQANDYMYLLAVIMFLLTVLNTFEWFGPKMKTGFTKVHVVMAVLTLVMLLVNPVRNWEMNLSAVICMGILLADITVTAWREKTAFLYAVHGAILVLFVHYAVCYTDMNEANRMILTTVLMGVLFLSNWKGINPLGSRSEDMIATAVILCNVQLFVLIRLLYGSSFRLGLWTFVTETGAILILTLVLWGWDRWKKGISRSCPLVLALVLIPIRYVVSYQWDVELTVKWLLFIYLILACLWDLLIIKEKKMYWISIIVMGFLFTVLGFHWTQGNLPYLLILTAYLIVKLRSIYAYPVLISGLLGLYLVGFDSSDHFLIQILAPAAGLIAGDLISEAVKPSSRYSWFSVIAGMWLYGLAVLGFAGDRELSLWYLAALAILFVWHYQKSYRMAMTYWMLAPSLMTFILPWVVQRNYNVGKDVIYTVVMVGLIVTTALARKKIALIEWSDKRMIRADWFHILQIVLILPMTVMAGTREWSFVYMLLIAGYALQYDTIPAWRQYAVTAAGIAGFIAFWIQPFIIWPDILILEIRLIPAAVFIWALPRIWGRSKAVWNLQTGLFLTCFILLAASAFQSQRIGDALMLEGICLTILIGAYEKKCVRWVKLSGGLAMGVALYVTRGFWLSISWWFYLLAAGIGLILFAAVNELKKR